MSTERQFEANRANAQHSTGPITPEGKAAVRLNGLKYGLYAETLILPGEDPARFEALLDRLDAYYEPATPIEEIVVSQIAMAIWRRDRIQRTENAYFRKEHKSLMADNQWFRSQDEEVRRACIEDRDRSQGTKSVLAGFSRYEARMDRTIKNGIEQLRKCRAERLALVPNKPVERPQTNPSPKIINIETVARPPEAPLSTPEPPPAVDTEVTAA